MEATEAWILRGVKTQPTGGLHARLRAQQSGISAACAMGLRHCHIGADADGLQHGQEAVTKPALGPQQIQAAPAERDTVDVA